MMPTLSSQWDPVDVSMCKEMFLFILLVFFSRECKVCPHNSH
jgi:hypothetical protein